MSDSTTTKETYRAAGWWRDGTFLDDLRARAGAHPDKPVVVTHHVPSGTTDVVTYGELLAATDRIAGGLVQLGVRPGEYVAAQLPNTGQLLPLSLACVTIGARIAPLTPVFRKRELDMMMRLTEARLAVTVPALGQDRPAERLVELRDEVPTLEHVAVVGEGGPGGTLSFEEDVLGADPLPEGAPERRTLDPDEPFLILLTSGTTGEAKGALHSQNTLYAGITAYRDVLGLDEGLVKMTTHTAMHYVGFVQGMLAPLYLGGTGVLGEVWDPYLWLELIEAHAVTMLYASPPFLREILEAQRTKPREVGSLRHVVSGSAAVPPAMVDEVRETLGTRLYSLWGMTENGPVTMSRPEDPEDWAAHSDGRATGGMELRIDPLEGRSDGVGPLWVRGPAQCLGYLKRDDVYRADLDDEGWFNTGDLARPDGRGGIRIAGRTKDVIMYKTFNVPVLDIERVIAEHPAVRDVALIGIADPVVSERVCAVVTSDGEPPTLDDLLAYLRERGVSEWYWPQQLEVVDALPRTVTGKVRKVDLRRRFAGEE